jgi:cellulose synthase/poly-beta-1,6-N-acetylglucosamine synthase-like glycosyltransferase
MLHASIKRTERFRWIAGTAPGTGKKAALLIPQFNESGNCNFEQRLTYFHHIKEEFESALDVIIIDDGSTDDSLEKIESFIIKTPSSFYVASAFPNSNKVGALYATVLSLSHEFIILSDFDTDIIGLDQLLNNLQLLRKDSSLMGGYFRMLPFEGSGTAFLFQQLEYALLRSLYRFHIKEQSVPIMPGAGCFYKRRILISIYQKHSGLRNGEDREATLLGLKMGYKTQYISNVTTHTRPPITFKALVKQRTRWYLGYLETLHKERAYYYSQIKKRTAMGVRTVLDIIIVSFILLIPFMLLVAGLISPLAPVLLLSVIYGCYLVGSFHLMLTTPAETGKFSLTTLYAVLLFPIAKISLEYIAWIKALLLFRKKRRYYSYRTLSITDVYFYQQAARQTQEEPAADVI